MAGARRGRRRRAADAPRRPNIVIILGDDMGYADMGSFGSEIKTPNLDSLAKDGVRFTNFYTHASCSPTRSMPALRRRHAPQRPGQHERCLRRPNQMGLDGYEATSTAASPRCRSSSRTPATTPTWSASALGRSPDRSRRARLRARLHLLDGRAATGTTGTSRRQPQIALHRDGRYLRACRRTSTRRRPTRTAHLLDRRQPRRPASRSWRTSPTAPHEPYHLPKEWRNRHVGEYDKGWTRCGRGLKREVELGIMPAGTQLAERMWFAARFHPAGAGVARVFRKEDGDLTPAWSRT